MSSATPSGNCALACCDLTFVYENNVAILSDFTIEFASGRPNYVVGPSGGGKTTMALLLSGILTPQSGAVTYSPEFVISHVLQFPENHFLTDSIEEEFATLPDAATEEIALATLARFGLRFADIAAKSPNRLSFGQRRLLAIAIQAALGKNAITFDEPTLGLDVTHLKVFADWITELCAAGVLCIIITHDLELLQRLPGYIFILDSGRVQWQGDSAEFLKTDELLKKASAI